jgi:hypothetical protein
LLLQGKANPRVLKAQSSADVDEIVGDAAPIYPRTLGLKSFVRRLYFLKPDVVIVMDEIETSQLRNLELRFHSENPVAPQDNATFLAKGKKAALRIALLTPEGVTSRAGEIDGKDREGKAMPLHTVQFQTTQSKWRNAVALSWSTGVPAQVTLEQRADRWVFRAAARQVAVSL